MVTHKENIFKKLKNAKHVLEKREKSAHHDLNPTCDQVPFGTLKVPDGTQPH